MWACSSSRKLPNGIVAPEKKGFAVDDVTMGGCSSELTGVWPHASDQVSSLRLFAAWKPEWDASIREESWQTLKTYVETNNARVLLGTELTFNQANDDQMWAWALDLMKLLGPDRIMGLSVGNEMDNIEQHFAPPPNFWQQGFFDLLKSRVDAMDAIGAGFDKVPITVVWSMGALNDHAPGGFNPKVATLFAQARDTWGSRWAWAFNPYPIWDTNLQPQNPQECQGKLAAAIGLDYTRNVMGTVRDRVAAFVGNDDYVLWVTESGWSSPGVDEEHQNHARSVCPEWADKETLWTFYKTMMEWDLSLPNGGHGVDQFFYFTMRDAVQPTGLRESFGLISDCGVTACKIDDTATSIVV